MDLFSGMVAFHVEDAKRFGAGFAEHLNLFDFAPSLGMSRSLILECDTESLQRSTFQLDEQHLAITAPSRATPSSGSRSARGSARPQ
jgi:cystathionine beta-lyase/cystathionine gamma-synthase